MKKPRPFLYVLTILCLLSAKTLCQPQKKLPACTQLAFAAFKPMPKLEYECPEDSTGTDDALLKLPARLAAIRKLESALASFTSGAWWQATVDELNACEIHGAVGRFTEDEAHKFSE